MSVTRIHVTTTRKEMATFLGVTFGMSLLFYWLVLNSKSLAEGQRFIPGEFHGLPPTGKSVKISELAVHRIAHGRIVEQWRFPDASSLNQQLGAATK